MCVCVCVYIYILKSYFYMDYIIFYIVNYMNQIVVHLLPILLPTVIL